MTHWSKDELKALIAGTEGTLTRLLRDALISSPAIGGQYVADPLCQKAAAQLASLAKALLEAREVLEEAAKAAYSTPHYWDGKTEADGTLSPGSPYDRGAFDAAQRIRNLKDKP